MIHVKRVYELVSRGDGARYLVDRIWPRGARKETLELDGWLKDLAPSDKLRKWFNHDTAKWEEFQRRYFVELDGKPGAVQPLLNAVRRGRVSLLFSARDTEHKNAIALRAYLTRRLKD